MQEIFKEIPNYNSDYQVSNLGNVKSFKYSKKGRILKVGISGSGYPTVVLCKNNSTRTLRVHKLVQKVFKIGHGDIDHINGIKTDNNLENLRVVTKRENQQNLVCHRMGKLVGTTLDKRRPNAPRPWGSRIRINRKLIHLGMFATELEAHKAYKKACDTLKL